MRNAGKMGTKNRDKKKPQIITAAFLFCSAVHQLLLGSTKTLVEAINSTTGINNLLLASVKRVTCRANIKIDAFSTC